MTPPAHYRSDIDGLRGIAILGVLVFHFFPGWLSGGFIGVDVFFVISGFLITGIVQRELHDHQFRLRWFYERRARRILPALALVLYAAVIGYLWLGSPRELIWIGENVVAAGLLSSNVYLWLKTNDYFSPDAEHNPLLHVWSLGVEEQFYVLFPLLLLLLTRRTSRARLTVLALLTLASLMTNQWLIWWKPLMAFYLLPARVWELGLGALLALYLAERPASLGGHQRCLMLVLGGTALAVAMLSPTLIPYQHQREVLLACLGTVLLIRAGSGRSAKHYPLSFPPLVAIGRISYSLYLWHWPLLALASQAERVGVGAIGKPWLLVASFVLAWASQRWVEQPARDRIRLPSRRFWSLLGLTYLPLALLVALIFASHGLPQRFSSIHQSWLAYEFFNNATNQHHHCYLTGKDRFEDFDTEHCLRIDPTRPNVLLFGDSHAAQYWPGLIAAYPEIHFLQANVSGCRPLLRVPGEERCRRLRQWIFEQFLPTHGQELDALLLAGRWHAGLLPALRNTLTTLTGRVETVFVLGPMVEYSLDVPSLLVRSELHRAPGLAKRHRRAEPFDLDRRLRPVVLAAGGLYVSVLDALCPTRSCRLLTRSGEPMHHDYGHLTVPGAIELVRDLSLQFARQTTIRNQDVTSGDR